MSKPLGIISPNQSDGTSLYRCIGPFSEMQNDYDDFKMFFTNEFNWSTLSLMSALFLQRPFMANHVSIVKKCKEMRKPVWLDYDDDLLGVTADNVSYDNYGKPEVQGNIAQLLQMADIVSVSTQVLADSFTKFLKNNNIAPPEFVVIPNAYNNRMFFSCDREEKPAKRILWRGTDTHIKDVTQVQDEIIAIANENPDYEWFFVGMRPWFLEGKMPKKKLIYQPAIDPITFMNLLTGIKPDICFAPLWDSPFNRSKSNIAWIEATHAGAVMVAPDFEEWNRPGITTYRTTKEFVTLMNGLMKDSESVKSSLWKDSKAYIQEHLTIQTVNKKRKFILDRLISEAQL